MEPWDYQVIEIRPADRRPKARRPRTGPVSGWLVVAEDGRVMELRELLAEYGRAGWKLANFTQRLTQGWTSGYRVLFKRRFSV